MAGQSTKSEKTRHERLIAISKTIAKALAIVVMLFLVFIIVGKLGKVGVSINDGVTSDVTYADGTTAHFDSKNFGTVDKGDVVTVHVKLPQKPIAEDAVLTFYIYHSVTEVKYGDQLLASYGQEINARGDMVGLHPFLVHIPDDAWGNEITVTLDATENAAFTQVKDFRVYTAMDSYWYYIDQSPLDFAVSFPMLVFGLLFLIVFLFSGPNKKDNRKAIYIAAFSIFGATWLMTSNGTQQMFGFDGYFWSLLDFISIFVMIIPIILYCYESEPPGKFRKLLGIAAIVTTGYFVVSTILNFTNVAHYSSTLLISHLLTFVGSMLLLIHSLRYIRSGSESNTVLLKGMLILAFSGFYDLISFNFRKFSALGDAFTVPSILPLGMLIFVIYLLRSYSIDVVQTQKDAAESENLSMIISRTPAAICLLQLDENLTIIEANEVLYNILGLTKESANEQGYKTLLGALSDKGRAQLIALRRDLLSGGESLATEIEIPVNTMDGIDKTVLAKLNYDVEDNTVTVGAVDITARKRTEDELRMSEERYRIAFEHSGKIFFFFEVPERVLHLSNEVAEFLGVPIDISNMPDGFLDYGIIEEERVPAYHEFFDSIFDGEESGEAIISCREAAQPGGRHWYKMVFATIFDAQRKPKSAVISCEDFNEQHDASLMLEWKQPDADGVSAKSYAIVGFDLTEGVFLSQSGTLFAAPPDFVTGYEEIFDVILSNYVYEDDVEAYRTFLDRKRLLADFEAGTHHESIEYRAVQNSSTFRWTNTTLQMIQDPYNGHVLAQMLVRDIHGEKTHQIEMARNMEELESELQSSRIRIMMNQMQPHFLYNALSAIQTIVKVDPDYASRLIKDFTVHLRSSIKALSSDDPIPFSDELKNIEAYLEIEQMRFGDSLKIVYEVDFEDFSVVPLSIQPIVENAVRHGVYPKGEEGGTVILRTYETATGYVIEVIDDGEGFDVEEVLSRQSDSIGLKNLIFRLKSLMNATVVIDSSPENGTKVTVTIPKVNGQEEASES